MPLTALVALACLHSSTQGFKDEITVKGMRLYARCWRTPTGDTPYMIWTIGSLDKPPVGQQWVIVGESIGFEGLPIQPVGGFAKTVTVSDPDNVDGPMVQQPDGDKAQVAVIRGHLEKVETLFEDLPLGDVEIVRAKHQEKGLGPAYHVQVDHELKLKTPSGITIDIPKQDAGSKFQYGALGFKPMAALHFHAGFKDSEEKIPGSPLFQRLGGPIEVEAQLKGVETPASSGFIDGDYVVEAQGFGIKPGPVKGAQIEIIQTIVLQSYPIDFRVPVKESKS